MQNFKQASKKILCASGVVAMLCLLVMLLRTGSIERSSAPATIGHSIVAAPTELSASFNTSSTIHRSPANRSNHCHFSLRSKSLAKLLLGKGSTIPGLSLARLVVQHSRFLGGYSSVISPPGYILFLFRYALF